MARPQFGKRTLRALSPEQYRKAAGELRRCADRIEADADAQDARSEARRSGAVVGAMHASRALWLADRGRSPAEAEGVTYCERCDANMPTRDDRGDLTCTGCGLLL